MFDGLIRRRGLWPTPMQQTCTRMVPICACGVNRTCITHCFVGVVCGHDKLAEEGRIGGTGGRTTAVVGRGRHVYAFDKAILLGRTDVPGPRA